MWIVVKLFSVFCLLQHFAFSPIKDGLQQLGGCCDGRRCTGIMSDTSELECVFNFLEVSERWRLFSQDICAADVALRGELFWHWCCF